VNWEEIDTPHDNHHKEGYQTHGGRTLMEYAIRHICLQNFLDFKFFKYRTIDGSIAPRLR